MSSKSKLAGESGQYSDEEAELRLEAALRGSRLTGHKSMADIPKKRETKKARPKKKPSK